MGTRGWLGCVHSKEEKQALCNGGHGMLRRHTPITLVATLAFLLPGGSSAASEWVRVLESSSSGIHLVLAPPPVSVTRTSLAGETYGAVHMMGAAFTGEPGRPCIPVWTGYLAVPPDAEPTVRVVDLATQRLKVPKVWPVSEQVLAGESPDQTPPLELDQACYASSAPYPAGIASVSVAGRIRGCLLARLEVHPVQYEPAEGSLLVHRDIELLVDFGGSPQPWAPAPEPTPEPFRPDLLNPQYAEPFRWAERPGQDSMERVVVQSPPSPAWRVVVDEDGLYRIDHEVLSRQKADLDLEGVDPRTIQMTHRGKAIPIWVPGERDGRFDPGDVIWFYGERNRPDGGEADGLYQDPFSDENVYWLSWGHSGALRLASEFGGLVEADLPDAYRPRFYEHTLHLEKDECWNRLSQADQEGDHWFWDPGIYGHQQRTYVFNLPAPARDAWAVPRVRVMLHGKTYGMGARRVAAYLNEVLVGEGRWEGQSPCLLSSDDADAPMSAGLLREDVQQLTVTHLGDDQGGTLDAVMLNWIEVEYPRRYWTDDDYIEFAKPKDAPPGRYQFTVGGFSSPSILVLKKGISRMTDVAIQPVQEVRDDLRYQVTFQDEIGDGQVRYLAVTPARALSPLRIEAGAAPDGIDPPLGADYILIAHEEFVDCAQRLAAFRESQGLRVAVVTTQAIYDAFNGGILSPEAIRAFIRHAYRNWPPPAPRYVTLVGDGTWDYKNPASQSFVPVYQTWTLKWGMTSSDHMYACVEGDDLLPELAVGRLPVSSNVELDGILDKIIQYERSPQLGPWRKEVLFIGGAGQLFSFQSESLINDQVPPQFDVSRLYVEKGSPFWGDTEDLIRKVDQGAVLVSFRGHGGGGIWSDAGLFGLEDVQRLSNTDRLPFVTSFTCFTAAFDEPDRRCLAEELLSAQKKGAVGLFGSTGLARLYNDYLYSVLLLPKLLSARSARIGDVLAAATSDLVARYPSADAEATVKSYLLLGDPAMRLGLPEPDLTLGLSPARSLSPGMHLDVSGALPGAGEGQATVEALDSAGKTLFKGEAPVTDGRFTLSARIPDEATPGDACVRAYFADGSRDFMGSAGLAVQAFFFGDMRTQPPSPTTSDTVRIEVTIEGASGVREAFCHWMDSGDSLRLSPQTGSVFATDAPWVCPPRAAVSHGEALQTVYFSALDHHGRRHQSQTFAYTVRAGPTLAFGTLAFGGTENTVLSAAIANEGSVGSDSVVVRFYLGDAPHRRFLGAATVHSVAPLATAEARLRVQLPLGVQVVTAEADGLKPQQQALWVDQFDVSRDQGTGGRVTHPYGSPEILVERNGVGQDGVWQIARLADAPTGSQRELAPARTLDGADAPVYDIRPTDPRAQTPGARFLVCFSVDSLERHDDFDASAVVARWAQEQALWSVLESQVDSLKICAHADAVGIFGIRVNRDHAPPSIQVSVDGQQFVDGGFLPAQPRISAVIQDNNGVRADGTEVYLDGAPADPSAVRIWDAPALTNTSLVDFSPLLDVGEHTIQLRAVDAAGNQASKFLQFEVASGFDLVVWGNFPNPFSDRTVLAYTLTAEARSLSIKIFTVAGHLVWSRGDDSPDEYGHPLTSPEYHEVLWAGTDSRDRALANGVYFCKFKATSDQGRRTVEKIIKLARTR